MGHTLILLAFDELAVVTVFVFACDFSIAFPVEIRILLDNEFFLYSETLPTPDLSILLQTHITH